MTVTDEVALEPAPGVRVVWDRDALATGPSGGWDLEDAPTVGSDRLRVLTARGAEGGLLLVAGVRSLGDDGHDTERLAALVGGPEGALQPAEEVLMSTEYGADAAVRRLGVEIYLPGEDYPLRGAGDARFATHPSPESTLLDFRFDGQPGEAHFAVLNLY